MYVRVESVSDEIVALGPSIIGFRVVFEADTLRGQAWFVPAGESEPPHCGSYSVETGRRAVRHLRVLPLSLVPELGVAVLPEAGNYLVRGVVDTVWFEGEVCGAYVRSGGWTFLLTTAECAPDDHAAFCRLFAGDRVEFESIGLSLWDENL